MNNDELQHYGVLGMKWGHRKGPQESDKQSSGKNKKQKNEENNNAYHKKFSYGKAFVTSTVATLATLNVLASVFIVRNGEPIEKAANWVQKTAGKISRKRFEAPGGWDHDFYRFQNRRGARKSKIADFSKWENLKDLI